MRAALNARPCLGSMLWSKQFYNYVVKEWLDGEVRVSPRHRRKRGKRAANKAWERL